MSKNTPKNTSNDTSKASQERESKRKFVRIRLPSKVEINEETYYVKDLSSAGIGIHDIDKPLKRGDELPLKLVLPFADFSLDIVLTGQVQYYDKKLKLTGCRFINLSPGQMSALNYIVRSYIAGDIIAVDDLFHVISKEKFVAIRDQTPPKANDSEKPSTRKGFMAFLSVVTVVITTLVLITFFENVSALKTNMAVVSAQTLNIRAPAVGQFSYLVPAGAKTVSKDQPLARITYRDNDVIVSDRVLLSPCDCHIKESFVYNNEFISVGENIVTLIPQDTATFITANVAMNDIHKIKPGGKAKISIAGMDDPMTGTIQDLKMGESPDIVGNTNTNNVNLGTVTIKPDEPIDVSLVDRPVSIKFYLR